MDDLEEVVFIVIATKNASVIIVSGSIAEGMGNPIKAIKVNVGG